MIGDKIILYRKRKGLTQEELADLLEVSRQTVTKWESGSVLPNLDYIMGLSVIFGITIDNLVKDNDCAKQEIESKISNYNWIDFMLKAKKATYAKKEGKTVSSRPNSHDYQYQENEYLYHDDFKVVYQFKNNEIVNEICLVDKYTKKYPDLQNIKDVIDKIINQEDDKNIVEYLYEHELIGEKTHKKIKRKLK